MSIRDNVLSVKRPVLKGLAAFKRLFQGDNLWFIALAGMVGTLGGLSAAIMSRTAFAMQHWFYGFSSDTRLSALNHISLWHLLALPLGGLLLGITRYLLHKRTRQPIDVVEANALYGGRIPLRDSLIVSFQTLISNGFGASVGLEAAYAQMGGGLASKLGQTLGLRRGSIRTLVGAGAGAAIGAAFGAPLAGTFYAFEIVLGGYTPATLAPVAVASLCGVVAGHFAGQIPFLAAATLGNDIQLTGYGLYALLGIVCAFVGILMVRMVTVFESLIRRFITHDYVRPLLGGFVLIGLGALSPQTLSAGHGAMHLDMARLLPVYILLWIFAIKLLASIVSLGFGFRGGLFFASLFLGSLLGAAFAQIINYLGLMPPLDVTNSALVGMAALAVAVVGGPMTMSLLVLEVTHDFALTAAVVTAALFSSAIVRSNFGYSFSTWRLHLRGEAIRNARDIGWAKVMTAAHLMRQASVIMNETATIDDMHSRVPLGSTSRVFLSDADGHYRGLVPTAEAYIDGLDLKAPLSHLAILQQVSARTDTDLISLIHIFDDHNADELAVLNEEDKIVGMLTEKYVRRQYVEGLERSQREFFGEG